MRALIALLAAVSTAAAADERGIVVRQFVGVTVGAGDAGGDAGLQLGLRAGRVLLRLTLDLGNWASRRGYALGAARGGYLHPLGADIYLLAGAGIGSASYGFIADDPVAYMSAALPEVGVLFGGDRPFGRVLLSATGVVPLTKVTHPADSQGQTIEPPKVLFTAVFSL